MPSPEQQEQGQDQRVPNPFRYSRAHSWPVPETSPTPQAPPPGFDSSRPPRGPRAVPPNTGVDWRTYLPWIAGAVALIVGFAFLANALRGPDSPPESGTDPFENGVTEPTPEPTLPEPEESDFPTLEPPFEDPTLDPSISPEEDPSTSPTPSATQTTSSPSASSTPSSQPSSNPPTTRPPIAPPPPPLVNSLLTVGALASVTPGKWHLQVNDTTPSNRAHPLFGCTGAPVMPASIRRTLAIPNSSGVVVAGTPFVTQRVGRYSVAQAESFVTGMRRIVAACPVRTVSGVKQTWTILRDESGSGTESLLIRRMPEKLPPAGRRGDHGTHYVVVREGGLLTIADLRATGSDLSRTRADQLLAATRNQL